MMNKKLLVVVGLTVLAGSLVFAGLAFAQTATPPAPGPGYGPGQGRGYGMMGGGRGMLGAWSQGYTGTVPMGPGMMGGGRGMMGGAYGTGPLHDYMLDAFAQALDLARADLDEQLAGGQTMYAIAAAQGLTQEEFFSTMQTVRETALAQAVADGVITQEQADWMGAMRGRMQGGAGGPGDCPHFNSTPAAPEAAPTNS
jgi:hypothetical protein